MATTLLNAPRQVVKTAPVKSQFTVAPAEEARKVAVITGASKGLGRATAIALAKEGFALGICARGREIRDVAGEIHGFTPVGTVDAMEVDVREFRAFRKWLAEVEAYWGRIDVLVNNAGYVHEKKPVADIVHADFDPCFETNMIAPMTAIQTVLLGMLKRRSGVIINVASKAGRYASPGFSAYNMSKAALISLTQTVAKELKGTFWGKGVRIYSVSPGGMNTEMRDKAHGDAKKQMGVDVVAQVIVDLTTANAPESGSDIIVSKKGVEVHPMEEWYE